MIYVIDSSSPDAPFRNEWSTVFPDMIKDAGYPVEVVSSDDVFIYRHIFDGVFQYKMHQFTKIHDLIVSNKITNGDVLIFTDAWNLMAPTVKYLCDIHDVKITLIGIWTNGVFDPDSLVRYQTVLSEKKWLASYERGLMYTYDYNCFFDADSLNKFLQKYVRKADASSIITGYPLSTVRNSIDFVIEEKKDAIMLCEVITEKDQNEILQAFKNYFVDYEFIFPTLHKFNRRQYIDGLKRSKILFSATHFENNPYYVYEGMLYGCVPIVPDRSVFAKLLPEKYRYPSYITSPPFMNFIRGREILHGILQNVLFYYDDWTADLEKDALELERNYLSTDRFLELIDMVYKKTIT